MEEEPSASPEQPQTSQASNLDDEDENVVELQPKIDEINELITEENVKESNDDELPETSGSAEIQAKPPVQAQQQPQFMNMRPQFNPRQKFQPRGMRWMNPGPVPFNQQQQPRNHRPMSGPGPQPQRMGFPPNPMRPNGPQFLPQRASFFMPSRPGAPNMSARPPQRFFFQNPPQPVPAPSNAYVPTPIGQPPSVAQAGMPRKVLINPNFKGGVEAAKSKSFNRLQLITRINY